MTEEEARRWPDLMAIVEAKVKPERDARTNRETLRASSWWQFARDTPAICYAAIRGLDRVLVMLQRQQHARVRVSARRHGLLTQARSCSPFDELRCVLRVCSRAFTKSGRDSSVRR